MNRFRFILASLRHYRRIHVAVALGVAVATAVLTGALVVGDSVRGSLRELTLERLGRIDSALVTRHFFRDRLADELAEGAEFKNYFTSAEPAILVMGTLQADAHGQRRRATQVNVVGCRESFWLLGQGGPAKPLAGNEVALTKPLAHELGVRVGDEILLRLPKGGAVPADSPLGAKDQEKTLRLGRFKVAAILPPRGLARFNLLPSQHLPRNVFVRLGELQQLLEKPDRANAILVGGPHADRASGEASQQELQAALHPTLADYGLRLESLADPSNAMQIAADQLVLPDAVAAAAERAFSKMGLQSIVTYLANTISIVDTNGTRKIPYSTITGVDSTLALGPLFDESGQPIVLADDEIVLNRWAAEDLHANIGDIVTVTYYEPESTHGELHEHEPPARFKLRAIVDLETADGKPTQAADQKLTPELPGVTDQKSIADWDLPFELVEEIRPQDETYWEKYRTTPKAFVSLATAKRLWKSRWGTISLLRLGESLRGSHSGGDATTRASSFNPTFVETQLESSLHPSDVGMTFLPVKAQGLAAASGTTPFDALFLGFSLFLIAAAVMLIALLFQLGVEQRAGELGTLAAVGVNRRRIVGLLSREGLMVAAMGAFLGVAAGVGYAWLMILGLQTWWVAAIATPFLALHVTPRSLALGGLIGVAVSFLTIRWSIRRLVHVSANRLLHGQIAEEMHSAGDARKRLAVWPALRVGLILLAVVLGAAGFNLKGETQASVFFGSGATVLALLLGEIRHQLRTTRRTSRSTGSFSLPSLAALNTARNPGRSVLSIGLVAAATFLIVAISAFRLDTGEGGTGGFVLTATSDQPIHYDLNTAEGRLKLGFGDSESKTLADWQIFSLRVASGEDASCFNLYRPMQPRVIGVPNSMIERGRFDWAAGGPWTLLHARLGHDERGGAVVPVVLDAATAIYSLRLKGVGSRFEIRDAADHSVTLQVVGLLKNSVLQGSLLMSEASFLRLFPDTGGYRYFLIEHSSRHTPPAVAEAAVAARSRRERPSDAAKSARSAAATSNAVDIAQLLESTLAAEGFDANDAREQLAGILAVQNTYLSTFQSLGALGLLLGTIGLAVVQLRSVLERRGELALMRATGFRRRRLLRMVVSENAVLLLGGLAIGCAAAAIALIPQWAPNEAGVPWGTLAVLLATIAAVGMLAGWLATRSALSAPLVPALRGD